MIKLSGNSDHKLFVVKVLDSRDTERVKGRIRKRQTAVRQDRRQRTNMHIGVVIERMLDGKRDKQAIIDRETQTQRQRKKQIHGKRQRGKNNQRVYEKAKSIYTSTFLCGMFLFSSSFPVEPTRASTPPLLFLSSIGEKEEQCKQHQFPYSILCWRPYWQEKSRMEIIKEEMASISRSYTMVRVPACRETRL